MNTESENFDVTWTAKTAKKVPLREAVCLVQEALSGVLTHADSESQFVQTFGKLTAGAESWNMLHLGMLQTFDGGMRRLKHFAFEHWLDLASDCSHLYGLAGPLSCCAPSEA